MGEFFKTIGQGILYLVLSPFILVGVSLYAVFAFFLFFVMFFKRIILFFKGEDMKAEMRMDVIAKMHLQNQDEALEKKEEDNSINVPVTNLVKEEKTTIVQPIIIQTDEEGRLKGVSYLNPNGQISNAADNNLNKIEQKDSSIEALQINTEKEDIE